MRFVLAGPKWSRMSSKSACFAWPYPMPPLRYCVARSSVRWSSRPAMAVKIWKTLQVSGSFCSSISLESVVIFMMRLRSCFFGHEGVDGVAV